jgi:nucleoside-diphosphate-sugar epimerase
MIEAPAEKIAGEIFNIGYQNLSISKIAEIVRDVVRQEFPDRPEITIETTESNDPRSYHINSDKIKRVLGYAPKRTIEDAVRDLCQAFKAGKLPDSLTDDRYFNVRTMKAVKAA